MRRRWSICLRERCTWRRTLQGVERRDATRYLALMTLHVGPELDRIRAYYRQSVVTVAAAGTGKWRELGEAMQLEWERTDPQLAKALKDHAPVSEAEKQEARQHILRHFEVGAASDDPTKPLPPPPVQNPQEVPEAMRGVGGCLLVIFGVVFLIHAMRKGWPRWVIVVICIYLGAGLIWVASMIAGAAKSCALCGRRMLKLAENADPFSGGVESGRMCTTCGRVYCRRCGSTLARCGCGGTSLPLIKVRYAGPPQPGA